MAFATIEDLQARWSGIAGQGFDEEIAATLLDDASVMLTSLVDVDPEDELQAEALKIVACKMVIRAMTSMASDAYGVTQQSIHADIYTQSWTYANSQGDLYLTKAEKKMLGISSGSYIGEIPASVGW